MTQGLVLCCVATRSAYEIIWMPVKSQLNLIINFMKSACKLEQTMFASISIYIYIAYQHHLHRVWGEEMFATACNSLAEEMAIPYGAPGGMPVYRLSLSLSFFYKFYLLVCSKLDPALLDCTYHTAIEVHVCRQYVEMCRNV